MTRPVSKLKEDIKHQVETGRCQKDGTESPKVASENRHPVVITLSSIQCTCYACIALFVKERGT